MGLGDRIKALQAQAREKAAPLVEQARAKGGELVEKTREKAAPLVEQARAKGGELVDRAKERTRTRAEKPDGGSEQDGTGPAEPEGRSTGRPE